MHLTNLCSITKSIISSDDITDTINSVKELSDFFKNIIDGDKAYNISANNEKYIKGGQALSTYHAAVCTDDYLRTAFFLKGVYRAINKLCHSFPDKKINILYAGCGPFATLILPLLPLLEKDKFETILLDINSASIQSAANLINALGLEEYNMTLIETDAVTYKKPDGWDIDLFISETMHYALTSEPQVSIMRNFMPQLLPHSIIIPEQIHIDLVYTFFGKEPFLKFGDDYTEVIQSRIKPERNYIDRLFTVNKDFLKTHNTEQVITKTYAVPTDITSCPDMCIFTEIDIFEDIKLKTTQSVLTNPYCITSAYNLKPHSGVKLIYDFSQTPKWDIISN